MSNPTPPGAWRRLCPTERERSALDLAEFYARDPQSAPYSGYGTVGHNLLLLAAKLAGLLDGAEAGVQWGVEPMKRGE